MKPCLCGSPPAGRQRHGRRRRQLAHSDVSSPIEGLEPRRLLSSFGPAGSEFQVNTTTDSYQLTSQFGNSVAADAAGNFVVVYTSQATGGQVVCARRFNADGSPRGAEFQVNPPGTIATNAAIGMDPGGDFVVAWNNGAYSEIDAQRFNAAGVAQGAMLPVSAAGGGTQQRPSVAMGGGGGFMITWASATSLARCYDASGVPRGPAFPVNSAATNQVGGARVAADAHDDFVAVWYGAGQPDDHGVYARRFSATGLAQGTEFLVNSTVAGTQSNPDVQCGAGGDFVVTWSGDSNNDPVGGVFARRFDASGVPLAAEFHVNSTVLNWQNGPAPIAIDTAGDFVIVWGSQLQDGSGWGIYGQRFLGSGVPDGTEFPVNTYTDSDQVYASLAGDANGDVIAVWTNTAAQDGSAWGVFGRRYHNASVVTGAPVLNSISVNDGFAQRSQVKSLTFAFDRPVALASGAVTLRRLNSGGSGANDDSAPSDASAALASPTTPDGGKTWTYTFDGGSAFVQRSSTGASTGSLADGVYTVSIDPTRVTAGGVAMKAAPQPMTFHRLFGDANGSKNVNTADYGAFRLAFGKGAGQAGFDPAFDFDNNGTVNTLDYGQFRSRFGKVFSY